MDAEVLEEEGEKEFSKLVQIKGKKPCQSQSSSSCNKRSGTKRRRMLMVGLGFRIKYILLVFARLVSR